MISSLNFMTFTTDTSRNYKNTHLGRASFI